jgi:hypothetical protein
MLRAPLLALALAALAGCDTGGPDSDGTLDVRYTVGGAPAEVVYGNANSPEAAVTTGDWEDHYTATPGERLVLQATSLSGVPVTAIIYVEGTPFRADRGLDVLLDAPTDGYEAGEVEVHGFIEAVSAARVTVLGLTFVVGEQTALLGLDAQPAPFGAFTLGAFAEAEGRRRDDGLYDAEVLRLEGSGDDGQIEVEGTIEALTATSVALAGYVFVVDEFTRCLDADNHPIPFSTFRVGDHAEVEGYERAGGALYAETLKLDT